VERQIPRCKNNISGMTTFDMRSKPGNEIADKFSIVIVALRAVHEVGWIEMDGKLLAINGSKQLFITISRIWI